MIKAKKMESLDVRSTCYSSVRASQRADSIAKMSFVQTEHSNPGNEFNRIAEDSVPNAVKKNKIPLFSKIGRMQINDMNLSENQKTNFSSSVK